MFLKRVAKTILLEIRNAESNIDTITSTKIISKMSTILPSNTRTNNKFMFAKKLDTDEFKLIDDFFTKCQFLEYQIGIKKECLSISVKEKTAKIQHLLIELAKEFHDNKNDYQDKKNSILNLIQDEAYIFNPYHPENEIFETLQEIKKVSTTTAGDKIKKIAR